MNKHSRALFRARHLCDSGLRSEVVIPLLMEELKRLTRFGCWVFAWSDDQGQLVNSVTSPLRPASLRYLAAHFDHLARDIGYSIHDAMRTFPDVSNPRRTGRVNPRMDETESYRTIWGPEGAYFNLTLAVRDPSERPLGLIQIFRPKGDVDFGPEDEDVMRAVLPYLRRLLKGAMRRKADLPFAQDGSPGVAVFGENLGPHFISDRAFTLATIAFNDQLPISAGGLQLMDPADRLDEMYREIKSRHADGAIGGAATPPHLVTRTNEWGTFSFEWELSRQAATEAWSVVIRHRIPVQLSLMFTAEGISLSERQLEVCRRLLEGEPTPLIAERIGVKRATLKDHTREIYRKFGVRDRDELLRKVISAQRPET